MTKLTFKNVRPTTATAAKSRRRPRAPPAPKKTRRLRAPPVRPERRRLRAPRTAQTNGRLRAPKATRALQAAIRQEQRGRKGGEKDNERTRRIRNSHVQWKYRHYRRARPPLSGGSAHWGGGERQKQQQEEKTTKKESVKVRASSVIRLKRKPAVGLSA